MNNVLNDNTVNNGAITQTFIANYYYQNIIDTYHKMWSIDSNIVPLNDNALFITFRSYGGDMKPPLDRFRYLYHWHLKNLMGGKWTPKRIYERQPVGMAAVDFDGSSSGYWVSAQGAHVHSVLVVHPELKVMTQRIFSVLKGANEFDFYYEPLNDSGNSLLDAIHYSLKGIMHERGFYDGRDELSIALGPYRKKLESNVVRTGREPRSKKPIFKPKPDAGSAEQK